MSAGLSTAAWLLTPASLPAAVGLSTAAVWLPATAPLPQQAGYPQ